MPNPTPSAKQLDTLLFLIAHVEVHGYQPSQKEMADHFGITKNAVHSRLKELAKHGIIDLPEGGKERAVILRYIEFKAISVSSEKPRPGLLREKLAQMSNKV